MTETTSELKGYFEYSTDLFDGSTIERMLGHFQTLLQGIAVNPDQRIGELPLLSESEKHQILFEWNDTKTEYPKDKSIQKLFEEQVERSPDALAVVFEDQQLTYRDLDSRANQLAHYLQKLGVGLESPVGLCMERSIEMVVGVLGILKAGGAYMPLDPTYPTDRLDFMLQDAQAHVLLTHSKFHNLCDSHTGVRIALDLDWSVIANESGEPPAAPVASNNLAYVIYTSGSTGSPKGVAVEHRTLCNHMHWLLAEFPLSDADRILLKTPHGFDASLWEIFAPLLSGARLVIARPEGQRDPSYLVKIIISNQITVLQVVPSLLNLLLQEPDLSQCTSLKYVFCGGEILSMPMHNQFSEVVHADLVNLYGPTEACIDATFWIKSGGLKPAEIPIGKPIANAQTYLLDAYLNPVPIGVAGELHIGGDGLARGYLNRPELTQEKFIPNPFHKEPGARLYKTGDLASYLPDGNIEFLGRIDNQVKIRGYRIEPGEIEAVLAQHPAIQQTVVLARQDTPGDRRLVAYCVATQGSAPTTHDLRSFLQHKLPEHMIPSAFVFMDSLPLTPNGKLDRKALPPPEQSRPELQDAFVAPSTPVEKMLANIWCEVLKLDQVGIHDNFFHLGGHSLLATQVVSRIRDALKLNLQLRILFEAPTIHGLVQKLQESGDNKKITQTAHITNVAREQYRVQTTNVQD